MTPSDPIQNLPQTDDPLASLSQSTTGTTLSSSNNVPSLTKRHFRYTKKHIWSLMPVLVLLVICMGVIVPSLQKTQNTQSHATATGTILTLVPATKTGAIGETFTLGVTMNTNSDTVSAAELHLSYNPTAIQILSFTPGTPLPVVLTPETHDNGAISVVLGAQLTTPFTGANVIGSWTVKILAPTQSSISFLSTTQIAALGKTTNDIVSTSGMTIMGVTPTSSLTPISTLTVTPTPQIFSCNRCSTINGCQRTQFQSFDSNCSTPIPSSTVIRTVDCSCPNISGGDNSMCSGCPTPTPTPSPTPIIYNCNRCSTINGCQRTQFQSFDSNCSTPIPSSNVIRTVDCSCPKTPAGTTMCGQCN